MEIIHRYVLRPIARHKGMRKRAVHAPEQLQKPDPARAYIVRSTQADELDIDAFDVIRCEEFTLLWPIIS